MTQDIALPSDFETGLEDFDPSEASIPRIHIMHAEGLFVDKQTNEQFPKIYGVFLGLIKQRVMWNKDVEEGDKPLCKSNDAEFGYPNITGPSNCYFPWEASGLDPKLQPTDEDNRPIVKCETCTFKEWRRTPGKNVPPPCSERYTLPIHFGTVPGQLDHAGIISFQRSSITPVKNFVSAFARTKQPLFSAYVEISLTTQKRGNVTYSVPVLKRGPSVPEEDWPTYVQEYRAIREMLRQRPRAQADDTSKPTPPASNNAWMANEGGAKVQAQVAETVDPWASTQDAPAAQWPSQPAQQQSAPLVGAGLIDQASTPVTVPATPTAPIYTPDDDDLPF